MATVELRPVPPVDAIAALRRKGYRITFAWQDAWQEEHGRIFTVAKAMRADLLEDIRAAVDQALADGWTLQRFREELTPILQAKGWWGRQVLTDPASGEARLVQLGSPRRLRIIYDTNMRTSRAAGLWHRIERSKRLLPYLRYVSVRDEKTRQQHRDWYGIVLPVDHPFWRTHYPPNGWNCRCTVMQLSARDLARRGWKVSADPRVEMKPWVNPRTGEEILVPDGIDPGFGYNVGLSSLRWQAARQLAERLPAYEPVLAAGQLATLGAAELQDLSAEFGQWLDAVAGDDLQQGRRRVVGALSAGVLKELRARQVVPASGAVAITDRDVLHMIREEKGAKRVPLEILRDLPAALAAPKAVLRDRRSGDLAYVLDVAGDSRQARFVVYLDFPLRTTRAEGKQRVVVNLVRTAGLVPLANLRDANAYEILEGAL